MKLIPNAVTRTVARKALIGRKNSPTILLVGGIVGFVATTVLASKATLQLDSVLEDSKKKLDQAGNLVASNHRDYGDTEYRHDVALVYAQTTYEIAKLYAPALVVGAASIAALTSSHRIMTKRNAALTAAYAAVEKSFKEYRKRVEREIGVDREQELFYDYEVCQIDDEDAKEHPDTGEKVTFPAYSMYARFFDQCNPNWQKVPEYNFMFVRTQQNYVNDLLKARGHVFLNDVYDQLGIERSSAGAVVGWVLGPDGDNYIDFGVFDGSNPKARDFVNGREGAILLDFNVDGTIFDKI